MSRDPRFHVGKFRYFCRTLQFDRANEAASSWPMPCDIPDAVAGAVGSLYAVRGEWNKIFELLHERAVDGSRLGSADSCEMLLEAVGRAARHTGRYEEVLAVADRWPVHATRAKVADLRDQIVEEFLLMEAIGLADGVSHKPEPRFQLPLRAERNAKRAAVISGSERARPLDPFSNAAVAARHEKEPSAGECTIYYCTDAKYLLGAAVSLFSLLRNNATLARDWDFVVYCAPEAIGFASRVFAGIAAHFGTSIDVRNAAGLLPDDANFRTVKGIHGLVKLSKAAYFRIYAALQLIREKRGRALYIDSDTCVGPGMDALLGFDLAGLPAAAWWEPASCPSIQKSMKRLGIVPGKYFNSGVLLFDLTHPQLEAALHRSIDVALNQQHLLVFLDQDCLNAAFKDLTVGLPEACNFFVRHNDEAAPSFRPVVTHFVSHPKPWDPCYETRNCIPWFDEFVGLGEILGPEMTRLLLRSHFEPVPNVPSNSLTSME